MTKQKTKSSTVPHPNTPQLRFPEFEGAWEKKKLGEVAIKINSGKTPLGGESVYQESGILFIRSQNVNNDTLSFENSTFISEEINNTMKNSIVKANDILLNITGASLGRSCVVPENFDTGNVNQHVCIVRLNNENNPRFLQPILSSIKGQNIFISLQTGSGREGLNFESIKGIEISFPTLPEQTKIATFLTAVDEKIQALKKKKSLLESYKKGVMQQLFPTAHTGPNPRLRFKISNDKGELVTGPDWEVRKLGEVAIRKSLKNKEDNKNVLTISAQFGLISQTDFFNKSVSAKDLTGYYLLERGDFAYNKSYSNGYPMGAIKCLNRYYKGVVSTLYICFRFNETINNSFMEQYFETGIQNIEIEKVAQEGARNHGLLNVGVDDFFSIDIYLPTLPEQTRIAQFLSALDEKIIQVQGQIEKTEAWKKGVVQRMFM